MEHPIVKWDFPFINWFFHFNLNFSFNQNSSLFSLLKGPTCIPNPMSVEDDDDGPQEPTPQGVGMLVLVSKLTNRDEST